MQFLRENGMRQKETPILQKGAMSREIRQGEWRNHIKKHLIQVGLVCQEEQGSNKFYRLLSNASPCDLFTREMYEGVTEMGNGIAAGYYGNTKIGKMIRAVKYSRRTAGDSSPRNFPDVLIRRAARALSSKFAGTTIDFIVYPPSTVSNENMMRDAVNRLRQELRNNSSAGSTILGDMLPIVAEKVKDGTRKMQKACRNRFLKEKNVRGKFTFRNGLQFRDKNLLIFDDIWDSGSTLRELGRVVVENCGAKRVIPLAFAKTMKSISDMGGRED